MRYASTCAERPGLVELAGRAGCGEVLGHLLQRGNTMKKKNSSSEPFLTNVKALRDRARKNIE
jgi:hypothetical protein